MRRLPPVDVLARVPLAPVMLLMGAHIRRNALILPEATGPRRGQAGQGPELRVLIVGDSSAAGVGVSQLDDALSGQIVKTLSKHHHVTWQLVAKTGLTTKAVTQMLKAEPDGSFDVAVLALGVNDAVRLVPLARWRSRQASLRRFLRARFGVQHILVTAVPPLEYFPALPSLLRWILGSHAQRMDTTLVCDLAKEPDTEHVKIDMPFSREAMASDGYHPSAVTYALWGQTMAKKILKKTENGI